MGSGLTNYQADFDQFIQRVKTLTLATVSSEGVAEASYAPFVRIGGVWYVYVSELATHTQNMLSGGSVSALLIESEADAPNLFARKRVSFQMNTQEVPRETSEWFAIMSQFEAQLGAIVNVIKGLSDFHLMALTPTSGSFVCGFAQAFALGGENMLLVKQRREPSNQSKIRVDDNRA